MFLERGHAGSKIDKISQKGRLPSQDENEGGWCTGVPRSQETAPTLDPTIEPCLWSYSGPRGGGRFLMSEVPRSETAVRPTGK